MFRLSGGAGFKAPKMRFFSSLHNENTDLKGGPTASLILQKRYPEANTLHLGPHYPRKKKGSSFPKYKESHTPKSKKDP